MSSSIDGDPRVGFAYDARMQEHTHEWPHIERAARLEHAHDHLESQGLLSRCVPIPGHSATDAELLTAHTAEHIAEVRAITAAVTNDPTNRTLREPDGPGGVWYSPQADAAARLSCGCVIDAAMAVCGGGDGPALSSAFALVRPPGHHAGYDDTPGHRAEGFCFYNSVAVAARTVLGRRDLTRAVSRVVIFDWDVHHGNGTQRLFADDPAVLYISLHRYDADRFYPKTGAVDEVGVGDGEGCALIL